MISIRNIIICLYFVFFCNCQAWAANNIAVLIGISQYSDPEINQLRFADEDVIAFKTILTDFSDSNVYNITTLLNDKATKTNILSTIEDIVIKSKKNPLDNFIFMYAGHGIPNTIGKNNTNSFLAAYDSRFNQFFKEGGSSDMISNETFINKAWLAKQLSSLKAKNIVLILDSCYSGINDFGTKYASNMGFVIETSVPHSEKRGIAILRKENNETQVENSVAFIASSRDDQHSAEYTELKHGALTFCIIEYINKIRNQNLQTDHINITIEDLFNNIQSLFDTTIIKQQPLSAVHNPVLICIPDYNSIKNLNFMTIRGIINPKPKTGKVIIDTGLVEAEVYLDGEKTGMHTNCTLILSQGKHLIMLYIPQTKYSTTQLVNIAEDQTASLQIPLVGALSVEAYFAKDDKPFKLEVSLDKQKSGETPLNIKDLVAGTHTIMVSIEGVKKETTIEIRPLSPLAVRYKIIRKPAQKLDQEKSGISDVTF
ncbi:MAG: caspase family protein [Nitrospirae bacterium]|nr:caspase family protein [Nitrospirota bacterium]